jgi:hypothetical protein
LYIEHEPLGDDVTSLEDVLDLLDTDTDRAPIEKGE